ncbi:MAG: alpha/beta hydrolase [Piscirickettsiaceae bacterium]|nr:MAG: alpha/beta hydrolase [Piscirickettsiaceae bacterium]
MQLAVTQTAGGKPPLVILHGLFGSGRNWQGIAKQLSDRFTVYALDLRNHGLSAHADDMDYPLMAADVVEFLDSHDLAEATFLGHSMGGKVMMSFASSHPHRVKKLVIVDIAPVAYQHNFDDILQALNGVPLAEVSSRKQADAYLAKTIGVLSLRQFLLQNLTPVSSGGYQWRVNLKSIENNMDAIMGFPTENLKTTFAKPTLFINGGKSTYLSSKYQPAALALFPNGTFQTVANAGHWPHIESPTEFMVYLNKFLNH